MGVRFLETYLEKNSKNACYNVNLPDIVHAFRSNTGKNPVLVMDGMSCLRFLYGKLSWSNGGQFKEFHEVVQTFIQKFTELGCSLVLFVDGPVQEIKVPMWKKRRIGDGKTISAIFNNLDIGTDVAESSSWKTCLPNGLGWVIFLEFSQHQNCKIFQSLKECDEEIAHYAFHNNCFAILAQDTDYVIYNAVPYYLSIKHLNLDSMTTVCYNGHSLCRELSIKNNKLPLLASLLGNDIVSYDLLKAFHYSLKRKSQGRSNDIVFLIANYIKHNCKQCDVADIAIQVFGSPDKQGILLDSISSYDLKKSSTIDPPREETEFPSDGKWHKIVQSAKKKYLESPYPAPLYDVLVLQRIFSSCNLEDYEANKFIAIGNLLKELRRWMYGILLHEKPLKKGQTKHFVEELVMTGFESMEDKVMVEARYLTKVKHPGLLNLWMSETKAIENAKWAILSEVFNVDTSSMKDIPDWLLIPVLATKYFKDQYPDLAEWELDALLATSVCVRGYEAQYLAELPNGPLTYRPIWIYSAITAVYANVTNLLFYIGDLIPLDCTVCYRFTDGKLFHFKYRQCKAKSSTDYICEHQNENLELFKILKSFVMNGHN